MSKDNGSNGKALSPEVSAIQTVDEFEEGHKRLECTATYLKKKISWEGRLLSEWKKEFDIKIPEGAGTTELEGVLRLLSAKYHKAATHKHNAEALFLIAQSKYGRMFNEKLQELTESKSQVVKGKRIQTSMAVERAKYVARCDEELQKMKQQMVVTEICLKMWEEILGSLRFIYGTVKNIQMGQMSENKLELANKFNVPAGIKG